MNNNQKNSTQDTIMIKVYILLSKSDKSSFSKNKSDVYSEDFEVVSEEEFTDSY
jgi:hypothetical protein